MASVLKERLATEVVEGRQNLHRVNRAVLVGERELRCQLQHKDTHPLAQADELLDVLAELEQEGLVVSELCFRLSAEGRATDCSTASTHSTVGSPAPAARIGAIS